MRSCSIFTLSAALAVFSALALAMAGEATPDISESYSWQPLRIGAGGWACGILIHPLDAKVRYLNADTGQTYRWDQGKSEWIPMIVRHTDGTGFPAAVTNTVHNSTNLAMAIDPSDLKTLYLYTTFSGIGYNVYKTIDGGLNFTATKLNEAAEISDKKNDKPEDDRWRWSGERLKVDPNNSKVLYLGTGKFGLFRSVNGGVDWTAVKEGNAPGGAADLINVHIWKGGGTASAFGQTVSKVIFVEAGKGGGIYCSDDGGQTWKDIAAGTALAGKHAGSSDLDPSSGALYVGGEDPADPKKVAVWKYADGIWSPSDPLSGKTLAITVDPKNPNRLFRVGGVDQIVKRSLDGGSTWQELKCSKANRVGFAGIRSSMGCTSSIKLDQDGCLWIPTGNDGLHRYQTKADNSESTIVFTIDCKGVENLCSRDIVFPDNGGGRIALAVEDETGMIIHNPDNFDVIWAKTNQWACSCGHCVNCCPNDPDTVAVTSYDMFHTGTWKNGPRHSTITTDGGATWTEFLDMGKLPEELTWGRIAISRRGDWKKGSDHMVWWCGTVAPYWSKDGGKTWTKTTAFDASGRMKPWKEGEDLGFATHHPIYWIVDRAIVADPFTPDKFFLRANKLGCFVSIDGGVNWEKVSEDPSAQWQPVTNIETNHAVKDDLWLHVAPTPATPLIYHSTDAGKTWTKAFGAAGSGGDGAYTVFPTINSFTLGAGSKKPGDAPYTIYVSGCLGNDPVWGVFRSTDTGRNWQRIAYYPYGLLTATGLIGASWDEFGVLGIAAAGQGYVYGKPK